MKTQLNDEIELIQHGGLKTLVKKTLEACPECFWTMPASTSGKHHPAISLGNGGLIRHTKAVVKFAQILLETTDLSSDLKDCVIAAAILHDCCKKADNEEHTAPDHPLRAAQLFRRVYEDANCDSIWFESMAMFVETAIAAHMGKWNTCKHAPELRLPLPKKDMEWLVHYADYLASRKELIIAENAPKYDPCRRFRKGDKVRIKNVNGRCQSVHADNVGEVVEVLQSEPENATYVIISPHKQHIDVAYIELVTPVEELEPYSVRETDAFDIIRDEKIVMTIPFTVDDYYTYEQAKEAAEAECKRLNEEWRKEQSNGN